MTREEAKRILYVYRAVNLVDASHREAFDMAISELDQEPCADAISREFLLKCIETDFRTKKIPVPSYIIGIIKSAPPVKPTEKMGQWIVKGESWYCTYCDEPICEIYDGKPYEKYCPNCGSYNGGAE